MGVKIKRIKHMIGRREQHESTTIYIFFLAVLAAFQKYRRVRLYI
jgi:hypothetical protein